jgi:hypothetical protein
MKDRQRQILFLATALISLVLLAAPASGADWFSFHVGTGGVGLSFGSSDWWAYGASWNEPHLRLSFDAVLNGYGEWVWVGGLGRVWRPWVAAGWTPYHHGRWVVTSAGWTWVSYEPWGYFPHHYGHWAYTSHGWAWVPGYTYRPANVVWVHWGGYVGWYPCAPHGWSHAARGFHRGYNHGYRNGYNHGYDRGYGDGWRDAHWATYVPWNHLSSHDISRHATSSATLRRTAASSDPRISETAPSRAEVVRRGVEMVPTARLEQRTVTLGGRNVTVARPEGMNRSVRQHARSTAERALPSELSRRVVERGHIPDATVSTRSNRSRAAHPADSTNRSSRTARSPRAAVGSVDSQALPGPRHGGETRSGRVANENSHLERSSTARLRRQPANLPSTSRSASHPSKIGHGSGSLRQPARSRQIDRPKTPEVRRSTARVSASPTESQARRTTSKDRHDEKRASEPGRRRNVSETRGKGTERVKRR